VVSRWWLFADGRTETVCVPFFPNPAKHRVDVVPTRAGLVMITQTAVNAAEAGTLFLATAAGVERLLDGWIPADTIGVSPDGCRLAFAYAVNVRSAAPVGAGRRTAKVIDSCRRERADRP